MYKPRLALGPITYFWSYEQVMDFYQQAAHWPVDIIYLGEVVCAKRRMLREEDWISLASMLADAGKEVVLSTLALIEAESELSRLKTLCNNGRFMVEANDLAAVEHLHSQGLPFVTGPYVMVYNQHTLDCLRRDGLKRWVLPVELSYQHVQELKLPEDLETEVMVYGRLPLALSARCFTARAHNLGKDACEFKCLDYPDGLVLATREEQPFLAMNGIQTQSAQTYSLIHALDQLAELHVDVLRISPQSIHMEEIVRAFRVALEGGPVKDLTPYMPTGPCNGYWYGERGLNWVAS